ncbi:mitochondrial inner membrane translocase subunit Tim17/Tim22/Tim23/peroxisomal protein PMP24 [Hyaloraphidium curvatum]|nr:mitochondrial inner membrane translocase subunit Tim17/Tim22/Tim23/peroxisomal protein PMP24 [Hyaloraphidium curvatum]
MAFPQQQSPGNRYEPPPPEALMIQNAMESCPGKTVISGVLGFAMGGVFGAVISTLGTSDMLTEEQLKLKFREQMKISMRQTVDRAKSSAKNLSVVGAAFAGTECVIETYRAKNDVYNGVAAGCITGAGLAARAGPQAMVAGCIGFAAFSAAIDTYTRNHH